MNQAWKARAGQFLPGDNLTVLPHWERKAEPVYDRAEVSVPVEPARPTLQPSSA